MVHNDHNLQAWFGDASECDRFRDNKLLNAVFAAFTAKSTLLDSTKSIQY
jgi:hypothetical protein